LIQIEDQIIFDSNWHIWIILCHHLVCFWKSIYFPNSKSNSLV
jgi:hypothetical protein